MDESCLLPNLAGDRVRAENARVDHAVAELLADLVTAVGIAEKAGVAINTVSVWQRRHATFPKPVTAPGVLYPVVEGRRVTLKLWRWSEVEEWIASRRRPAVAS